MRPILHQVRAPGLPQRRREWPKGATPSPVLWTGTPSYAISEGKIYSGQQVPVTAAGALITLAWVSGTISGATVTTKPAWVTFSAASVTPTISFSGHVDANDVTGMILSATANGATVNSSAGTITVTSGNRAPEWATIPTITFYQNGAPQSYALEVSDPDGNSLTLTSVGASLPTGVTLNSALKRLEYDGTGGAQGTTSNHIIRADDGVVDVPVTTFTLTSTSTQTDAPFMLGVPIKNGDIPAGQSAFVSEPNARVVIKRRWNDGSVKHAIIVGRTSLTANVAKMLTIYRGAAASWTNLTSTSIQSAAPTASVQCGSIGTVSLSSLLATPFRTFISTPEMVECHYRSQVGADTNLIVWFHVRLWAGGRMWVRAVVENGFVTTSPGTKTYAPTVIVGGTTVYSAASISHYAHARWTAEGWIGGNPEVTPAHNVAYCISTKLLPNYWKRTPSASALNALTQTYTPMALGQLPVNMQAGGWADYIGLIPNWDALYCTSADPRAWRSMLANSSHFGTYSIFKRSATTNRVPMPSSFPSTTLTGYSAANAVGTWELNHLANEGYAAYLFSGDYFHLEQLGFNASACYFAMDSSKGSGTNRIFTAETRGTGWSLNVLGHFCAIAPTEGEATDDVSVVTDYRTLFTNNATHWAGVVSTPPNQLGSPYQYILGLWGDGSGSPVVPGTGTVAWWMTNFWVMVNGHVSKIEPVASMANFNALRDFMYKWTIGMLGDTGASNFHFSRAGSYYGVVINNDDSNVPSSFYQTWGEVWTASFGSANAETSNALSDGGHGGGSSYDVANIYAHRWPTVLAAMAYAKDDNAVGADAAWARLTGASNWNTFASQGWSDLPLWGIVPRGYGGT